MRLFPMLFGEKLKHNHHFLHYISLSEMDDEFNLEKINILRLKIDIYLRRLIELYPEENIKPKQHFLIHYPRAILIANCIGA
jgi:hypothetical protein